MKVLVLTGMLVCAACAVQPESDRAVRRERLDSEHRALVAQIDELQARASRLAGAAPGSGD